jgi:hypothetical protein
VTRYGADVRQGRQTARGGGVWNIKDKGFEPRSLPELSQPITTAVTSITRDILHKVWEELDFRLDNHHISYGDSFKSLTGVCKTVMVSVSTDVRVQYVNAPIFCFILKL